MQYLESINNKAYGHALNAFASKEEQNESYEWVHNNPYLQKKMKLLNTVYQAENSIHKKLRMFLFLLAYTILLFWSTLFIQSAQITTNSRIN